MNQGTLAWSVTSLIYVIVLILGGVFGLILKSSIDSQNKKKISRTLTELAIYGLIPPHVFLSIVGAKTTQNQLYNVPLLLSGVLCCSSIILVTHYIAKAPQFRSRYDPHFKYVASTMGGGGRAVVLLAGVMPLIETIFPTGLLKQGLMLDIFAIFDFGYWIFFNAIVFGMLMPLTFGTTVTGELPKLKEWGVFMAVTLGMIVQYFDWMVTAAAHDITLFLRFVLTIAIVGLSSAGVVLNVGGSKLLEVFGDIQFIFFARLLGLAFPSIGLALALQYFLGLNASIVLIPVLLMLVLPPSSIVAQMLEEKGARPDQVQVVANINVAWNVLLLIVVVLSLAAYSVVRWVAG